MSTAKDAHWITIYEEFAPWTVVVGLILIYAGLKLIGVALPF